MENKSFKDEVYADINAFLDKAYPLNEPMGANALNDITIFVHKTIAARLAPKHFPVVNVRLNENGYLEINVDWPNEIPKGAN